MNRDRKKGRRAVLYTVVFLVAAAAVYLLAPVLLKGAGNYLVVDQKPVHADAVVVLNSGIEYYPRLLEAAELYRSGLADTIVINGNRKTDLLRELEAKGFAECCPWDENSIRILSLYGVPRERVIGFSVEDAYDTISEAKAVGNELLARGIRKIIVATSKYHTRRAGFIWRKIFKDRLTVWTAAAAADPYDPNRWWQDGRQIRWVMAEYGAWVFYYWKKIKPF